MRLPWIAWEKDTEHLVDGGWSWKCGGIAGVSGFDVDGGAEARLVNIDVNIKEGDKVNWTG